MRAVLVMVVVLASGAARAERKPLIGDHVALTTGFPGCTNADAENRMVEFFAKRDEAAAMTVMRSQPGSCRIVMSGTSGEVTDESFVHDTSCVRPAGESACSWLPNEVLKRR